MERYRSACPLDCPDACSLEVTVEDGRVVAVDGSHLNPMTAGFVCSKVRAFADYMYAGARIAQPAIRVGEKGEGAFRPVSWDEALDLVSERLWTTVERLGSEAILPCSYGGSNGMLTQDTIDARLFTRMGTSQLVRNLCAGPSSAAAKGLYGRMPGVAYEDYVHAGLITVWGANPSVSSIHLVPWIKEAQKRGAKLVVIDPRRTQLARKADLHLPVRPGTDLAVALAVVNWLFENDAADLSFLAQNAVGAEELRRRAADWPIARAAQTADIDPGSLEAFARMYAASSPAVIRCGWGPERSRSGGSATAAILAIPAVGGKFGVRGGGYTMSQSGAWSFDSRGAVGGPLTTGKRAFTLSQLGRALCEADDPPIAFLFVYNCNPVATVADQRRVIEGLERSDLYTVVFDQVLTDTARYADLILPATTFLEHRDLHIGYGSLRMRDIRPAVDPVGEARSNCSVFAELCARMGLSRADDAVPEEDLIAAILDSSDDGVRIQRSLAADGQAIAACSATPVQFLDTFPRTADGKIHLVPESLDRAAPAGLYRYQELPHPPDGEFPLTLISPASAKTISSTFGHLVRTPASVGLNPDDARARGIGEGDAVRVWNRLGEVACPARLDPDVRPGVAVLAKGLWCQRTANGATANALIPDHLTDIGHGPCYHDARVEIARA